MSDINIKKLSDTTGVCEWLGFKPTKANADMVEETITRFLLNSEDDGVHFDDSDKTEVEIVEWVVDHLERQYEYCDEDDKSVANFAKKALKAIYGKYRDNPAFAKIIKGMKSFDFIEKMLFGEQAKTLPEGSKTWRMTFNSRTGGGGTYHYVVKGGKWVRA